MTYRKVSPYPLLARHWPSRSHPQHAGGSLSTPALLLLVIKRPIGSAARCIGHPLGRVNLDDVGHLGGRARGFLIQCPRSCHPLKFIDQFFLSHHASFPSTLVLASW